MVATLLTYPEKIQDRDALIKVLRKWTGRATIPYPVNDMYTQQRNYGNSIETDFKTYSRGKHTLIFRRNMDPQKMDVELYEVIPKVLKTWGLSYAALQMLYPLLDPTDSIGGWGRVVLTITRPLTHDEIVFLVAEGMGEYSETDLRLWF